MLWPQREADKLAGKTRGQRSEEEMDDPIVLQAGFGPSGQPHIGHLSEVVRTSYVRQAVEEGTDFDTELIVFSDDLDGFRSVPEDVPDEFEAYLGQPLCELPDPHSPEDSVQLGGYDSWTDRVHGTLTGTLDRYGVDYEFHRASDHYRSGDFYDGLRDVVRHREAIREIILPTLSEENRSDWSMFFPICEACGSINDTQTVSVDLQTVDYRCDCGHRGSASLEDGEVKVGWKIDWALRWHMLGVDYEMYGKDLIESFRLSSQICEVLGSDPPLGYQYEMFLDEDGEKISSSEGGESLGDGLWETYSCKDSLRWFFMQNPSKARTLGPDTVRHATENWLHDLSEYEEGDTDNPIHYAGLEYDSYDEDFTYSNLLNMAAALNGDRTLLREYVFDHADRPEEHENILRDLYEGAHAFYHHHLDEEVEIDVSPQMNASLKRLWEQLRLLPDEAESGQIQDHCYRIANDSEVETGEWFSQVYLIILGQDHGPRLGELIEMVGLNRTAEKIFEHVDLTEEEGDQP